MCRHGWPQTRRALGTSGEQGSTVNGTATRERRVPQKPVTSGSRPWRGGLGRGCCDLAAGSDPLASEQQDHRDGAGQRHEQPDRGLRPPGGGRMVPRAVASQPQQGEGDRLADGVEQEQRQREAIDHVVARRSSCAGRPRLPTLRSCPCPWHASREPANRLRPAGVSRDHDTHRHAIAPGLVGQTIEQAAGHPRMRAGCAGAKVRRAIWALLTSGGAGRVRGQRAACVGGSCRGCGTRATSKHDRRPERTGQRRSPPSPTPLRRPRVRRGTPRRGRSPHEALTSPVWASGHSGVHFGAETLSCRRANRGERAGVKPQSPVADQAIARRLAPGPLSQAAPQA
jgi:hypothetical protein